jgi:hypothetical protein
MTTTTAPNPTTNSTQITTVLTVAKIASGKTQPGATNWQVYNADGIYVDVDTTAAQFTKTPVYVTSIGGDSEHWKTTGASSVYSATEKGFRIYIRWANGGALTPAQANSSKWHINWIAIEPFSGLGSGDDGTQSSSAPATTLPTPGKYYYLTAKHTGKGLAVTGAGTANGANVVQWDNTKNDHFKWLLEDAGNGDFYLIAKHSGKGLVVNGANTADGANVVQWDNTKNDHFRWKLEDAGNGYFYLIAKHSGKALEVNGGNQQNGGNVDQWIKQDVDHHKWKFEAV